MTTQKELTKNYSGIFGNLMLLRNRRGKSVMTIPPARPEKTPSEAQLAMRERFSRAAEYASNAMQDPALKAEYAAKAKNGRSAYVTALADFLRAPIVSQVDTSGYNGNAGDKILIAARDDFRLVSVSLKISDTGGKVIEEGECVLTKPSGQYEYVATQQMDFSNGVVIQVHATDLPGNVTEQSITL
jgi:hypothetical protein